MEHLGRLSHHEWVRCGVDPHINLYQCKRCDIEYIFTDAPTGAASSVEHQPDSKHGSDPNSNI